MEFDMSRSKLSIGNEENLESKFIKEEINLPNNKQNGKNIKYKSINNSNFHDNIPQNINHYSYKFNEKNT